MTEKDIFHFNHIDKNIRQEKISGIKASHKYYHKKSWCYKSAFKFYKRLNLAINLISVSCVATGTIVGGITLIPIILGSISGAGLLLKTFGEIKGYKRKIDMCKFAYTTYEKVSRFKSVFERWRIQSHPVNQ